MSNYPKWVQDEIAAGYIDHGIHALLSWQLDALNKQTLRAPQYGNFIFSAPTSSGKTVVAELIAVNTVKQLRRKAIFIFPYVSVAKEKFLILQKIWRLVDLRVSAFIGSNSVPVHAWDAAVCTIEKANSLLNHMIDNKTIFDIGVLIIDEFHMLFDGNRGPLVEHIIGKALYIANFLNHRIQILSLSATLPNLDELGDWLNAERYETQFRPVQLHEMIMCDSRLQDVNTLRYIRTVPGELTLQTNVEHTIIRLCAESVAKGESVLVFCSSKTETEKLALAISHYFEDCFKSNSNEKLISSLNIHSLERLKLAFHHEVQFVDDILEKTIAYGIAFHHAGLTIEERETIEHAFHEQSLRIVCATSTLSSGINLPAHRVIIKAQMCGPVALNGLTYMQMIGRAGRLGQTTKGESIVVCNKNQLDVVQRIIQQKAIFARRCEIKRRRIKLIIEAICSGLCSNENELKNLLSLLFFDGEVAMEKELNFLLTRKLIYHQQNLGLRGTQLGRAVFSSSLSPDIALQVYNDLEKAMRSLALDTELHLLYLVTPLHNDSIWMNYIDWNAYYKIWSKLPIRLQRVGKMIGILDSFILGKLQGRQATETSNLQVHLRFLSALALFDLIKECPLGDVARRFRINRGALQTLQQQSATYAYMVVTFCEKLGWTYLRSVLDGFSERLTFGVRKDLTELVQIEGIDGVRARACHNANITTVATLAITSVDDITKILRSAVPFIRRNNSEGLNRWLAGEGLMTDVEAAKLLIQRARQKLSSSLRAVGIFSDAKIDSLFSTVKSINEIDCDNLDDHNGKCGDNQDFASDPADLEFTSLDFLTHGSCPVTTASENSEEQNSASTQSLAQTSEVTEKKLSEMELLKSDELDEMKQTVLHDYSGNNYETLDIPDRLKSDDVEQLCLNFSHTSMSDETLLRFGCSQSSGKIEQITQTLDAVTVLANNEKFARIKSAKQDEQVTTDLGIFQSSNISSLIQNENPISATAEALNLEIYNDNKQSDEEQNFINSKLNELSVIQFSESSSTDQSAFAMQQPIPLGSIEEEKEIVVNSSEKIGNQSTFDSSADLFDQTFCSSVNSQSINTPHNSSHSFKRINRRSSISQSSRSPSFQSPLHKVLKLESSFTTSTGTEIKFNKSVQGDVGHFTNDQTEATEFQIIDVCGSCTTWKQLLTRQKYWDQIGLGIAWCSRNVIGVALCALNEKCFYIDFTRKDGYAVEFHERLTALDNLLKSEQQKYIYDLPSVSRSLRSLQNSKCQNWQLNNCICVQTLSYLAHYRSSDNDSPLSFQDLLSRLTSPERAAILKNATPRLQAVINSFICLHMHDDLMSAAIRLSSTQSVKLEMQSVVLFSKIEATGISFDANQAKSLADKLKRKMTEVETKAYHIAGISFNFASASEISQVLFVRLRIPPPNISTGRHYSTNKMVLQRLAPKYPIVNLILDWRRMNTALTASLPILLNSCCSDGRIRATFAINCSTGRVLTMNPNVQNVQKQPVIDGFSIRSLFIAPTGRILLSSDYRQLEMRILAHLSDDPYLISMFLAKGDFFETVATKWNANENFYMKVDRNKVKQLCYGILYGMGATTLSKELNIQKQHAQQLIVSFFQQFPKVRIWMDKILTICRADGYVSTFLGRRRYLPNISDMLQMESAQAERQAINTCIQGSAAELFKIALLKLQKNLSDTNSSIVMQLHDEVLVETDENSVASVVEIIRNSMISAIPNLRVPLVVRISSGKSWGELQEYVEI